VKHTLQGDLKWAISVLAGFALGALVLGADAAVLIGALVAVVILVLARAMLRLRRGTTGGDA
jgi:hypothetical protein